MERPHSWHMLLSTRGGGVPKGAEGAPGGSQITSKMGKGGKFRLSSVLPNVFSKIKGIRRHSGVHRLSSSASVTSAASDLDQKDFSIMSRECSASDIDRKDFSKMSRDAHRDRSSSPKRGFPQNRSGHSRHTSSPVRRSQKAHESISYPTESPMRSKGSSKSRSLSPPLPRIHGSAEIVDPGCCSFDSTMALVPHDGRVRRIAPQALGKCLIMSKCNSFNGSTQHSDSDISETDSSTTHARMRHSRAMSAQLERSSSSEGLGPPARAAERGSQGSGKVSVRGRSSERRDPNVKTVEQGHQLVYGGSSPIHPAARSANGTPNPAAKYCRSDHSRDSGSECRGSGRLLNSGLDRAQSNGSGRYGGRPSRKLSFAVDENAAGFDDTSFSSDDDLYKAVMSRSGNVKRGGHHRSQSTSSTNHSQRHVYAGNQDSDLVASSADDERKQAKASRPRETALAMAVLNAGGGLASQDQLSRFSPRDEKPAPRSYDGRDAAMAKGVPSTQGWARDNLRALAKANELDRQTLARLKAGSLDARVRRREEEQEEEEQEQEEEQEEEAADKIEYESFGLNPFSREFFSWKSSRHPSPISEEVEKYTEGRVDYSKSSDAAAEEFAQRVADYGGDVYKGARPGHKAGREFGKPWDTEFPSFRSDSILMGGGGIGSDRGNSLQDERAPLVDCNGCGSPGGRSRRYPEKERQSKSRGGHGKVSTRSPSAREDTMSAGALKNLKPSIQSASPRLSSPKRSAAAVQEFGNGKKGPTRTPSPGQETKGGRRSSANVTAAAAVPSLQQQQLTKSKSSRTPSPARSQSPQAGGKPLTAKAEAGMQRLDSVAVVKASYDPYQDFRESMVEMILENDIRTSEDLEDLLQCYLSLNSAEYHKIIVEVFTDVWGDIFDQ